MTALKNADASGNKVDAEKLAAIADRLQKSGPSKTPTSKPDYGFEIPSEANNFSSNRRTPAQPATPTQPESTGNKVIRTAKDIYNATTWPVEAALTVARNAPVAYIAGMMDHGTKASSAAADKFEKNNSYQTQNPYAQHALETAAKVSEKLELNKIGPVSEMFSLGVLSQPAVAEAATAVKNGAKAVGRLPEMAVKNFAEDTDKAAASVYKRVVGTDGLTEVAKKQLVQEIHDQLSTSNTIQEAEVALAAKLHERGMSLAEDAKQVEAQAKRQAGRQEAAKTILGDAASPSQTGDTIHAVVTKNLNDKKAARATTVAENLEQVSVEAKGKEAKGEFVSDTPKFKSLLETIKSKIPNTDAQTSGFLQKFLDDLSPKAASAENGLVDAEGKPLSAPKMDKPSFEKLEDIRRALGDRAAGHDVEGYKAISTGLARDLRKQLSAAMEEHTPSFGKYLSDYAEQSKPMEVFTKTRRGAVASAEELTDFAKTDPSKIPDKFLSKQGIDHLTQLFNGNREQVQAVMRRYVADQMGNKSVNAARGLATGKLRDLLQEFPDIKADVNRYLKTASQSDKAHSVLTKVADDLAKQSADSINARKNISAQMKSALVSNVSADEMRSLAAKLASTPGGKKALKDAVNSTISKMTSDDLLKHYDTNIRPALAAGGMHSPKELAKFDNVIHQLRQVEQRVSLTKKDFGPAIKEQMGPIKRDTAIATALLTIAGAAKGPIVAGFEGAGLIAGRSKFLANRQQAIAEAVEKMIDDPELADEYLAKPTPTGVKNLITKLSGK